MGSKPFSESCEQNKAPILAVLKRVFDNATAVLEVGSGTGQHAVHFARHLPHLMWQTSDVAANHEGIAAWLADAQLPNVGAPLLLEVCADPWPAGPYDAVFSANTSHIMSMRCVACLFAGVGRVLRPGGVFALYGPFNYGGQFTSDSNLRFDAWLKARDPESGLRDVEALNALAGQAGMVLEEDCPMPVNNRTLVWRKGVAE